MKIVAIIPARYASSRFPGKPLADICGKPMIWWVYDRVKQSKKINEVYVATDDERIEKECKKYGMNVVMTSSDIKTSTERLYEVAKKVGSDLYICVNGDEPLIDYKIVEKIIPSNYEKDGIFVSNLMTKIKTSPAVVDFTNIKVVTDKHDMALFFSRSPIPYPKSSLDYDYYKHVGILIYNYKALEFFATTKRGKLEDIEDVNEIRFLENGIPIKMVEVDAETLSVDTPKDLEEVKKAMKNEKK